MYRHLLACGLKTHLSTNQLSKLTRQFISSSTSSLAFPVSTSSSRPLVNFKAYSTETTQPTANKKEETQLPVKISESCIKRLKELRESNKYLRVLVDSGGCSGFEYKFSLDSNINPDDNVIEKDGCKILIDNDTIGLIKGSTIDYYEELIRTGFRIINNPNSERGCSCGTSFSIKI